MLLCSIDYLFVQCNIFLGYFLSYCFIYIFSISEILTGADQEIFSVFIGQTGYLMAPARRMLKPPFNHDPALAGELTKTLPRFEHSISTTMYTISSRHYLKYRHS